MTKKIQTITAKRCPEDDDLLLRTFSKKQLAKLEEWRAAEELKQSENPVPVPSDFYSTSSWRKLRDKVIKERPYCELSLVEGIKVPAIHVHHLNKFFQQNPDDQLICLLSEDNLICVSEEMHNRIHHHKELLTDKQRKWLEKAKMSFIHRQFKEGCYIKYIND